MTSANRLAARIGLALTAAAALALPAAADTGDTAWILTSTALVLFMTLPGLALFYGGLVQAKNVLSVLMQCFVVACLMSVLWLVAGYSIAFGDLSAEAQNPLWGGLSKAFLGGVTADPVSGQTIPEGLFFMFQMTFAIITPALILGALAERVNFAAVLIFCGVWMLACYAPVAHWVWGGGWLAGMGVTDFAGGLVVHATAGIAALVFAIMMGKRTGFPKELKPPHNPGMVMIGAAMLWVGWFGFNAGSALGANGDAARAMIVTHISAATASLVWMAIEWKSFGRPSLVGTVTGMVAGLATITPAAGSVGPVGALIIGTLAAVICYFAVQQFRVKWQIDDSLDVFAVHGVGGILGTLLIPLLGKLGPMAPGYEGSMGSFLGVQAVGVLAVCALSLVVSVVTLLAIKLVMPLRVDEEAEDEGLDTVSHGETAYNY